MARSRAARGWPWWGLLAMAGTLAGCVGVIGAGDEEGVDGPGTSSSTLGADDTRRLSPEAYRGALRALLGDEAVDDAETALQLLPNDKADHEFTTMARGVSAAHVDGYFAVARAAADAFAADPARRGAVRPCLADTTPDAVCVRDALSAMARLAYRRAPTQAEVDALMGTYEEGASQLTVADGLALAVLHMLQSPSFLYLVELGDEQAGQRVALAGVEIATRLSFFLTGAPPDHGLLDRAEQLREPEVLRAEAERLMNTDAARAQLRRFVDQWLKLNEIPVAESSATFLAGIEPSAVRVEMQAELEGLVEHHVFDADNDYATMMRSDLTLAGPELAKVYGVQAQTTPTATSERGGLLTRAGVLADPREHTQPILRAARVLRHLLCDDIELPPPSSELVVEPPPFDAGKTARERWTAQTSGGVCGTCHERINPFGFALEAFDSMGRPRALEPIVDPASGATLDELPIDTTVTLRIDGDEIEVDGASALSTALAESGQARACFARKWFRFSFGRRETAHEIETMLAAAGESASLRELLTALVSAPNFAIRTLPEEQ